MRRAAFRFLTEQEIELLTPDEKEVYFNALTIEEALAEPADFMAATCPEAQILPHVRLISDVFKALVEKRLYKAGPGPHSVKNSKGQWVHPVTGERALLRLQIDLPPRHTKSMSVSHYFINWYLANFPGNKVALASYEADFAREWGGKVQEVFREHPEFGVDINPKKQAQDDWGIKGKKGGMFTAGAGGPLTGKGFHLGVIDDPLKNQEEALSELIRTKLKNWFATTFFSRRQPGGDAVIVLMATRWHEDDLSGHVIETEPDRWYRLSIPAISWPTTDTDGVSVNPETGERDPLGRGPGEALAPALWSIDDLLEIKSAQGEMWFQAMYQGHPSIAAGNKFRNFANRWTLKDGIYTLHCADGEVRTYKEKQCYRYATVDLAATEKTRSDWTVWALWDVTHDHRLILRYIKRERINSDKHTGWFVALFRQWKPRYAGVENKTFGLTLIQNIRRLGLYAVKALPAVGDKEARAVPATEVMGNDLLYLPKDAEWLETWIQEHKKFPNATHDDQVDTTSYGVDEFNLIGPWMIAEARDDSPEARMDRYMDEKDNDGRSYHEQLGIW